MSGLLQTSEKPQAATFSEYIAIVAVVDSVTSSINIIFRLEEHVVPLGLLH